MDPLQRDKPYRKTLIGRWEAAFSAFAALLRRTGAGSIAIAIGMLGAGALLATTLIFPPAPVQQVFGTPVADDVLSTPFERPNNGSIQVDTDDGPEVAAKDDSSDSDDGPVGTDVLGEFIAQGEIDDDLPVLAGSGGGVKLQEDGAQPGGKTGTQGSGGDGAGSGSPWNQGSGGTKVGSGKSDGDSGGTDGADLSTGNNKPPKPSGWDDGDDDEDDGGWGTGGSGKNKGSKKDEPKQVEQPASPGDDDDGDDGPKVKPEKPEKPEKASEKASKDDDEVKVQSVEDDGDDEEESEDSESSESSDSDD